MFPEKMPIFFISPLKVSPQFRGFRISGAIYSFRTRSFADQRTANETRRLPVMNILLATTRCNCASETNARTELLNRIARCYARRGWLVSLRVRQFIHGVSQSRGKGLAAVAASGSSRRVALSSRLLWILTVINHGPRASHGISKYIHRTIRVHFVFSSLSLSFFALAFAFGLLRSRRLWRRCVTAPRWIWEMSPVGLCCVE